MDFTKDYKNKVNSLLMERWGYGKMDEAIEGHDGKPCSEVHPDVTHLEFMNKLDQAEELDEMQGHPGKCCDMAHPDEEHDSYVDRISIRIAEELRTISITEELPAEEEPVAEPEEEFGKSKLGGGEFRKSSIETGKEAGAGGFTNRERGVIGDLQKKMAAAAEAGDIVTGKALKLAKLLAAEMDAIMSKK